MASLLTAAFGDDHGARAAAEVLRSLHADGTITVYAAATVARGLRGAGVVPREPLREGTSLAAPAVAVAVSGLVSLLGGPVLAAARTLRAGLVGAVRDLEEAGVDAAFLERIGRNLPDGGSAILAEVEEGCQLPLEGCLVARGGRVFRRRLSDAATEQRIVHDIFALRDELARLRDQVGRAMPAELARGVRRERERELQETVRRARSLAAALRREGAAKVLVLREQAQSLDGDARTAIERRAAAVRTALERRAASLDRAAEDTLTPCSAADGAHWRRRPSDE